MRIKVMIVDDDLSTRETMLDYLTTALGCDAVAVADVRSAVAAAKCFKPDLILTDFNMPGATGLDLIKEVKTFMPYVSIVMMTACDKIETAVEAMKMGAEDYLTKPFNLYQMDLLMQKVCEKKDNIKSLDQLEAEYIESVIAQTGSIAAAATKLGINASTIFRKRRKVS